MPKKKAGRWAGFSFGKLAILNLGSENLEIWKFGGAAGEPPPGSEKPDCRFLQAQLRICLKRTSFSKPEFRAQQMQLFSGASRISLSVLAVLYDRGKDGNGNLSPTVVT
jgi:hypothetical protein